MNVFNVNGRIPNRAYRKKSYNRDFFPIIVMDSVLLRWSLFRERRGGVGSKDR